MPFVVIVLCLVAVATLGIALWLIGGALLIVYLSTRPPRRQLKRTPESFGATYEQVSFPARDDIQLSGWFLPCCSAAPPKGVIILCHGMLATRVASLHWAEALWKAGFSILLFDFRAFGESEGKHCTGGFHEPRDLQGALDYLETRADTKALPAGVFGFSMGGATAILTAPDDARIRALVTHGAYTNVDTAIDQRCRRHFGIFAPIAGWVIRRWGHLTGAFLTDPADISPIEAAKRLESRPTLILHGDGDRTIPFAHAHALHKAVGEFAEVWILPDSGHSHIPGDLYPEVQERVVQFFNTHLTPPFASERVSHYPSVTPDTNFPSSPPDLTLPKTLSL